LSVPAGGRLHRVAAAVASGQLTRSCRSYASNGLLPRRGGRKSQTDRPVDDGRYAINDER